MSVFYVLVCSSHATNRPIFFLPVATNIPKNATNRHGTPTVGTHLCVTILHPESQGPNENGHVSPNGSKRRFPAPVAAGFDPPFRRDYQPALIRLKGRSQLQSESILAAGIRCLRLDFGHLITWCSGLKATILRPMRRIYQGLQRIYIGLVCCNRHFCHVFSHFKFNIM